MGKHQKPVSESRLASQRANSKKSTGPITNEGKLIVAQNALTHGMLAQHVMIASYDPSEHKEEYARILEGLLKDFKAKTTKERLLVERMAAAYWRLRRAFRFEARCIDDARRNHLENPMAALSREISKAPTDPLQFILPSAADIEKLVRYEGIIDRTLHRTLLQLRRLRAGSRPHASPADDGLQTRQHVSSETSEPLLMESTRGKR